MFSIIAADVIVQKRLWYNMLKKKYVLNAWSKNANENKYFSLDNNVLLQRLYVHMLLIYM